MFTTVEGGQASKVNYRENEKKDPHGMDLDVRCILFIGLWMIIQIAIEGQWMGIILGAWLAIMGLFGLGCAAGNCFNGSCEVTPEGERKQ